MKVIVAGLPKTGTKSMQLALTILGYHVYDFMESFSCLGNEWEKIFSTGGRTEDFYHMFKDVDAITDNPAAYFWDEIHKAFPDAKVILTMRDSEDGWAKSMEKQRTEESTPYILLMSYLSPTFNKFWKFASMSLRSVYGTTGDYHLFKPSHFNMTLYRMTYRRHNSHVLQTAPRDKLLIFNVKEGWEPLCKFLGKDVPDMPFPHRNVRGQIVVEMMNQNSLFLKSQREMKCALVLIGLLSGFGVYKLVKCGGYSFFSKNLSKYIY